jgi:D-beta-D-heptose 7-phosphate kinase/D-beta-D-heptose 1-phosphate adenosyltransferase
MIDIAKKIKVAVVGDLMVDYYHYGKATRVSPEFPVIILTSDETQHEKCCGGAANVAYQFLHLNAEVTLFGFKDSSLDNLPINTSNCVSFGSVPKKHRYYSENYPMFRHDVESSPKESINLTEARNKVFENFKNKCSDFDIVIFSNYAKGFFDKSIIFKFLRHCKDKNITTISDPKNNINWWKDCDIIKPNFQEAVQMTGISDEKLQIEKIKESTNCKSVVVTRAGTGVFGCYNSQFFEVKPDGKQQGVNSVIGAGDCFLAYLSSFVARGKNIEEATRLSFVAASIYVQNKHNKPVHPEEVIKRINPISSKIVSLESLCEIRKNKNVKWVISNGCFDILGKHHVELLNFAKKQGDLLVVAVNSDSSIKKLKGESRPINCLKDRMDVLANLESVDYVVCFEEMTPLNLIEKLKPSIIVKGGDYKKSEIAGCDIVGLDNVILFPFMGDYSTTKTINLQNKISSKEMLILYVWVMLSATMAFMFL